jgi:D-xylose transport system substrate-binding protein
MYRCLRGAAVLVTAVSLAVGLGACGQTGDSGGNSADKDSLRVGLLLPENQTDRYERYDRPLIQKKVNELCPRCTVDYANAHGDVATQHQQMDSMISKGADVLILDAVDVRSLRSAVTEAETAGIPVLAYDRLVDGPISAYVSYDGLAITGEMGKALLKAMGDKADGGQVVRVEGPQFDPTVPYPLRGKVKVKTYSASAWDAEKAHTLTAGAIASLGPKNVDGIWAANDAVAAGVITALKAAHVKPMPPVVGQDAELAAVQRIVKGEQYMTVYKPYKPEADTAAEMAVTLGRGEKLGSMAKDRVSSPTTKDIPAVELTPVPVTVHNIKDTVVKDGRYTVDEICTPKYRAACEKAHLVK